MKKESKLKFLGNRGMHSFRCQAALCLMLFRCTVPSDTTLSAGATWREHEQTGCDVFALLSSGFIGALGIRLLLHKVIGYYCIRRKIGGLALLSTSVCMFEHAQNP